MKLSIIICVYNTPTEYFEPCLRSITESTLSGGASADGEDYEICVVDDGSDTDYSELIKKYRLNYVKTENRGIFSARLTGIAMAKGEYIAFVDSDDTVSWNYHRPMLKKAREENLDIVINDWAFNSRRTKYFCKKDSTVSGDMLLFGDDVLRAFLAQSGLQHSFYVLWNKLYRAELLQYARKELLSLSESEERFNFSEDALMNFYAFAAAKRLGNVHTGYYFYRIHSSQSVAVVSAERLKRQISCMAYTLDRMENEVGGLEGGVEFSGYIKAWRALMSRTHFSHAKGGGYTELYPFIKEKYGVKKLERSKYSDSRYYSSSTLLPENVEEIDAVFLGAYKNHTSVRFTSDYSNAYVKRGIDALRELGCTVAILPDGAVIPKPRIKLKNKIVMNGFVRRAGLILFPKGSRIRAILKKAI